MLKRNDKCYCGSGKKYKNCCMNNDKKDKVIDMNNQALELKKNKNDRKYRDAILKLSECIERLILSDSSFAKFEEEARKDFFNEKSEDNLVANRFFASYFSYDYAIGKDLTPAIVALNKFKFTNDEKKIISNCIRSYPSLFVIERIEGKEVDIRDLFTQKIYSTLDAKILGDFSSGDYIIARPVYVEDTFSLIDLTIRIQEETKDMIYNNLIDAYKKSSGHDDIRSDIEYFVALNSLFFYLYMIQLLQLSNYDGIENTEAEEKETDNLVEKAEKLSETEYEVQSSDEEIVVSESRSDKCQDKVEYTQDVEMDAVLELVRSNVKEDKYFEGMKSIWSKVVSSREITGAENGWAAGLEYNYRKSLGENVTQNEIAKIYGVSASTLAKRNKEIASI